MHEYYLLVLISPASDLSPTPAAETYIQQTIVTALVVHVPSFARSREIEH